MSPISPFQTILRQNNLANMPIRDILQNPSLFPLRNIMQTMQRPAISNLLNRFTPTPFGQWPRGEYYPISEQEPLDLIHPISQQPQLKEYFPISEQEPLKEYYPISPYRPFRERLGPAPEIAELEKEKYLGGIRARPEWYSQLQKVISQAPQEKWTAEQLKGYVVGKVKKSELEYFGIPELKGAITKTELLGKLEREMPQLEEVVKGGKYIPTEDEIQDIIYNEVVPTREEAIERLQRRNQTTKFGGPTTTLPGGENYREIVLSAGDLPSGQSFISSHFPDVKNPIAHIRANDRTTPDGKKVLFIEEIQSDWAREARKFPEITDEKIDAYALENYKKPFDDLSVTAQNQILSDLQVGRIPSHPLLKNWQELALKRAVKEAVEGGYDYLSWTTGEQQAERYDLSKQIDTVALVPAENFAEGSTQGKKWMLQAYKGDSTLIAKPVNDNEIDQYIGKDISPRLLSKKPNKYGIRELKGVDLKIGGEWAKNLYDRQVPNTLRDLTKGEIEDINLGAHKLYEIVDEKGNSLAATYTSRESAEIVRRDHYPKARIRERGIKKDIGIQPALKITPTIKERIEKGLPIFGKRKFGRIYA